MTRTIEIEREILHGHLFCGIGGGAIGFNRGSARVGNVRAKFVCVGGIDSDAAACRDFKKHVGTPATCLDLFSLEQYRAFHNKMPPPGWTEAVPDDVRRAFGNRQPNIIFLSAPCLPADGLVLTDQGEVEISKLSVGDKVLTHRGRYRRVSAVGCNPYVGDMNAFRLNGTVDVQRFTDEHPIWVRNVAVALSVDSKETLAMRNISFMLTVEQFKDGSKDVTRRDGWLFLKAGNLLCAAEKCQGLGKGGKIVRLGTILVVSVRREKLSIMVDATEYGRRECRREGFPDLTPEQFVEMFCKTHKKVNPDTVVTRIEFERVKA